MFYGQTHRRQVVAFDGELRALTARIATETRSMIMAGHTPPPRATPACRRCSLAGMYRPQKLERPPEVGRWLQRQLMALEDD